MNSCPHNKDILNYILGTLDNTGRQEFDLHLKKCKLCQKELQIESLIAEELSESLQPGEIEDIVLARVRLLKDAKPDFSWLYFFRMIIYGMASIVAVLAFSPKFMIFVSQLGFELDVNILEVFNQIEASSGSALMLFIGFGIILVFLSSVFSYTLLRRE